MAVKWWWWFYSIFHFNDAGSKAYLTNQLTAAQ